MPTLYVLRGPDKGRTFKVPLMTVVVGRHSEHVPLADSAASREHAVLRPHDEGWVIEDLNSSNGTYIGGKRVREPTVLTHGDQIKVGSSLLLFSGDEAVDRFSGPTMTRDLVEFDGSKETGDAMDSSILSAIPSNEDSAILASPETADAVNAWKLMYQIAEAIGTFVEVEDFLERITDLICDHFVFDRVLVLMGDPGDEEFTPQVVRCRPNTRDEQPRITASRRIIHHVRQTKNGILCANAMTDQRFADEDMASSVHSLGLRSVLCVPIIAHNEVHGVIDIDCAMAQHTYTQDQLRLATAIGRMTGLAIENARLIKSRMESDRLAAMGETVAYLSHHIRNILQGLNSGSDVLEMGIKRNDLDTIGSAWKIIQRNLDRTLNLASNLLTFSKDREPVIEMVQLNSIVDDVIGLAQRNAQAKGVQLSTNLSQVPPAPLDKEGIHQAVLNLVMNAIDASPESEGRVLVTTEHDTARATAIVSVTDNGPGIEEEQLVHIFEPYRSTKGHGGTGLGLAAARKIVLENKGEIQVKTTPGTGSTFEIIIPAGRTRFMDNDKTDGLPRSNADPQHSS